MAPTTKTLSAAQQASQLRVSVARLARRLRQEGAGEDATPSQLAALATLYHEGPLTFGELAHAERVKPPSMTRIVAALEERGLVTKEVSPGDRRVQRLSLTPAGRAAHEEYRKRRDMWLSRQLSKLDPQERDLLRRAADILDRMRESDSP